MKYAVGLCDELSLPWWETGFENRISVFDPRHFYRIKTPTTLKVKENDSVTNARIKRYLMKDVLQVANADIFTAGDFETTDGSPKRPYAVSKPGQAEDKKRSLEESQRRAKSSVTDIALCNRFTHMFTWTLDGSKINRYDADEVYRKVRYFLNNMTKRKSFKYVLIPEYHKLKEGEEKPAIHMHGLCKLGDVKIERARHKVTGQLIASESGREVYNMLDWKLGYSTVVPLDENYEWAVSYIAKYITKSKEKIFGKWYLSSRDIVKSPDIVPLERVDYESFTDPMKQAAGIQFVSNVFRDIKIIYEEYPHEN